MELSDFTLYIKLFDVATNGLNAIILWCFLVAICINLFYQVILFGRLVFYKSPKNKAEPDPVSVIIASRDDAMMLRKHLPLIMNQKGITFEVIVVDDCSLDDTVDVLRAYSEKHTNFKTSKLVESGDFEGGKKFAVTMGIKAAKYQNLVFIDADCYPNSESWLRIMGERLMGKKIVLGYGPYKRESGLLNKLIRFDTYKIATQYLSLALWGMPYMGVGRNSGDDDLFINEVANSRNTGIEVRSEAHVPSIAKAKYAKWEFQKRRHLTTAPKYKGIHQLVLMLLPISNYVLTVCLLILLILNYGFFLVLWLYGIKLVLHGIVMFCNMKRLEVLDLFVWSMLLEPLLMLFYPWVTFLNIVKEDQRKRWI
jgi:glycosyltransferase involved in cell wall biosynthesis